MIIIILPILILFLICKLFSVLNFSRLANGRNYISRIDHPLNITRVENATFYWTLSSPIPPKYYFSKPSIYLKSVKIIPTYLAAPSRVQQKTKTFCPPSWRTKIKHKEEVSLVRC